MTAERWAGIERPYTDDDAVRLRGSLRIDYTLAQPGSRNGLAAPARRAVRAGPRRADRQPGRADGARRPEGDLPLRLAGGGRREPRRDDVPDQSLYPANSVPPWCGGSTTRYAAPTRSSGPRARATSTGWRRSSPMRRPASAGPLNAFELMKGMIEAGAAGVHFEDQLASEKKCGHLGGKVLVPTGQFIRTLIGGGSRPTSAACRPCSSRARTRSRRACSRATSTSATRSS